MKLRFSELLFEELLKHFLFEYFIQSSPFKNLNDAIVTPPESNPEFQRNFYTRIRVCFQGIVNALKSLKSANINTRVVFNWSTSQKLCFWKSDINPESFVCLLLGINKAEGEVIPIIWYWCNVVFQLFYSGNDVLICNFTFIFF